jgi:lipopolysaccharide cholinephosphotransferase
MKKITLHEMQEIELSLLKKLKKVCTENNIRYYLDGGTLLGAVRHKGFIPWDDDIDVFIPRNDYQRLISLFSENQVDSNIKLLSMYHTPDYYYLYAKLVDTRTKLIEKNVLEISDLGVFIDIFPLDGFPDSDMETVQIHKKVMTLLNFRWKVTSKIWYRSKYWPITLLKRVYDLFIKRIGFKKTNEKIDSIITQYRFDESTYVGSFISGKGLLSKTPKSYFQNIEMRQFEDDTFTIPAAYHEYLTQIYGDYMELPPFNQRITHHKNIAFWI